MNLPLKVFLTTAIFLSLISNVFGEGPIPLLEEGSTPPSRFSLHFSEMDRYERPEYFRSRDRQSGITFRWSAGIEIYTGLDSVRVYINGNREGLLPWQGNNLKPGLYRFRLEKEGYLPEDFLILLEPEKRATLKVDLIPLISDAPQEETDSTDVNQNDIQNPENGETQPEKEQGKITITRFNGLSGTGLCPYFPNREFPRLSAGTSAGLVSAPGDYDWKVPLEFGIGTGILDNWFFSVNAGMQFGSSGDQNSFFVSLGAARRLSSLTAPFQFGLAAHANYNPLLRDPGYDSLFLENGKPYTGLYLAFPLSMNWESISIFGAPEIGCVPISAGIVQGEMFSGVSFFAAVRAGTVISVKRFTLSVSGSAAIVNWTNLDAEDLLIQGLLECDYEIIEQTLLIGIDFLITQYNGHTAYSPGGQLQFFIK